MSELTIKLPKSLAERLNKAAELDETNAEQFVLLAVAEKIANLNTANYLETRAKRANLNDLDDILAKIPDIEPEKYDKIK
jgi:uncharacterized protein (DUF1778 family)